MNHWIVPTEPTPAMVSAAVESYRRSEEKTVRDNWDVALAEAYRCMLDRVPTVTELAPNVLAQCIARAVRGATTVELLTATGEPTTTAYRLLEEILAAYTAQDLVAK